MTSVAMDLSSLSTAVHALPGGHNANSRKGLKLLSLDGGGVRGLSSLLIIQRMMQLINPSHPPKPCDYFDLIGGTSTGGLIAVMLGRLRMDVSEAIDIYLRLSQTVFQPRRNQMDILSRARDRIQLRGKFDGDTLAQVVKDIVVKCGEDSEARLLQSDGSSCKVFVCSVLQEVSQQVLLRSYISPGHTSHLDVKIWEACRATSAATSFFDPVTVGPFGQKFSDGATGWNNPIRQVYSEARRMWPTAKIQCLVSIGTGKPRMGAFGESLRDVAKTLVRMATETELTAEEFLLDHVDLGLRDSYFRFNVSRGLEEVGLQEYSAVPTIASATMTYLEGAEISEQMAQCVKRLQATIKDPVDNGPGSLTPDETTWLHSLYTTDYAFHRSTIPRPVNGTCLWFLEHVKYRKWDEADHSSLLWVSGDPGCGKSVLSSFLVDKLTLNSLITARSYTTLYFFCDDKIEEHRDAAAIMRGILHQLVSDRPGLLKRHGANLFKSKGARAAKELLTLWDLFKSAIQDEECPPLVIVIDALDECEEGSRDRFLSLVAEFFSSRSAFKLPSDTSARAHTVKMLITSRPEISIAESLEVLDVVRLKAEDETASISRDVVLVTQQQLKTTLRRFNPPAHVVESLSQKLTDKAGHTFLWASLMLQMIERSAEASEEALGQIVTNLPDGLDDIYEKILSRCQGRNREKARLVLQVIVSAARALTLEELSFAICVRPGDTTVDDLQPRVEPNLSRTLQMLCGPFLKITRHTVMLVHQTAKEFLVRSETNTIIGSPFGIWKHSLHPGDSHLVMARACLLALTQKRNYWKKEETPFAWYALDYWITHLLECEDVIDTRVLTQVMSLYKGPPESIRAAALDSQKQSGSTWASTWDLSLENLPLSLTRGRYYPDTALGFASLCGFSGIMEQLLEQGKSVNLIDYAGRTPIDYASLSGREDAVRLLLDRGANPDLGKPGALKLALISRSPAVVHLLLTAGARRSTDGAEEMALALETGHDSLARLLIEQGVRADVKLDESGDTPLIFLAKRGSRSLVDTFIGGLHATDKLGRTAINWAAEYGQAEMVRLLVARGANLNRGCAFGDTPLSWAVKGCDIVMARYLLDQGADPNVRDIQNSTPLWWAVVRGYKDLVSLLLPLTRLTDGDLAGRNGSLGWWARRNGHDDIAQMVDAHAGHTTGMTQGLNFAQNAPVRVVAVNMMVHVQINGTDASAIVATAASATVMSSSFAKKCGIFRLVDTRYSGVARGVGTANVIGRVHSAQILVGNRHLPASFTVIEESEFEVLLGLDFLRRWRCMVDLRCNRLVMPFEKTSVKMFEESLGSPRDGSSLFI